MKEIKFRAWQSHKNKMLSHEDMVRGGWSFDDFNVDGSKSEIMQYTGLKDKKGKEIYEGDIVNQQFDTFVVEYGIQEVDAFEGIGYNLWSFMEKLTADGKRLQSELEVVGNIYENPELLRKEQNEKRK